jgi:hypothetical protein
MSSSVVPTVREPFHITNNPKAKRIIKKLKYFQQISVM